MIRTEIIKYVFFGVCTTLINIISYIILINLVGAGFKIATSIAWVISVVFAFIVNQKYVFNNGQSKFGDLFKQLILFAILRILSYFLDLLSMVALVDYVKIDDIISKVLSNILVVITNYFASKFIVFKNKKK
ncbi:GtrA-like protein [compost metagenome]